MKLFYSCMKTLAFLMVFVVVNACSGSGSSSDGGKTDTLLKTSSPIFETTDKNITVNKGIKLSCADEDAVIYYTIDNSYPTVSSTKYTGAFKLSAGNDQTVKAIALADGKRESDPAAYTYNVTDGEITPVITASPQGGTYYSEQTVVLSSSNSDDDVIYYTLDGSSPSKNSSVYSSEIVISQTTVIKAFGITANDLEGGISSFSYIINSTTTPNPVISPEQYEISIDKEIEISCSDSSADIYYTTNSSTPTIYSTKYSSPFKLSAGIKEVKAIAKSSGKNASSVVSKFYKVIEEKVKPVIAANPGAGTYDGTQYVVLSSSNDDDIIYYTTNGNDPDENSQVYSSAVEVGSSLTIKAYGKNSDGVSGNISSFSYTINEIVVTAPVISPNSTDISINDPVSITAERGTIRYTIDDSNIGSSSTEYTGSFKLSKGIRTVRAIAVYNNISSSVTEKVYNVTDEVSTVESPVISAVGNKPYNESTVFEITCGTSGATIEYKVDSGSYSSYTSGFNMSEGKHTVSAIAKKSGMTDSGVSTVDFDVLSNDVGIRIYYKSTSSTPTIWVWEPDGNSFSELMGYTWDTQPAMIEEGTFDDWYYFDIPSSYAPFNKIIKMKFNKSDPEISIDPADGNFWYDGSQWTCDCPDVAVTPVISASPEPKTYRLAQNVTLSGSNSDDEIYYTTNGADPTSGSILFNSSKPISVSSNTIIKAMGINRDGVEGSVYSFSYIIDANYDDEAPTIEPSVSAGNYESAVSISFKIKDNKSAVTTAYYTVNAETPDTTSTVYWSGDASGNGQSGSIVTINMDERKTYRFLVKDKAGNKTFATFRYSVGENNSGTDFREETIYFVMTTRFYDGDSSNNELQRPTVNDNPEWRGDFKGLIQKLDYIKALGFTAIWITPVVKNKSGYDYHGYHAVDFNTVDPRYESSDATYQDLIDAAHDKGLKIIQDIVLNHTGNWGAVGMYEATGDDFVARKEQLVATEYWHDSHECLGSGDYVSYIVQTRPIADDCMDLDTENYNTQQHLINAYDKYIEMGVDAFRIDTVKHMSRLMLDRHFIPAFKEKAAEVGTDHFYMFGEVCNRWRTMWEGNQPNISAPFYTWNHGDSAFDGISDADAVRPFWDANINTGDQPSSDNHLLNGNDYHEPDYSEASGMGVIDFLMHWNFENASTAYGVSSEDYCYNDATWNVTYVDSHDYGPDSFARYNGGTAAWAENMDLMWTFRGIPCVFYGSEIEFMAGQKIDDYFNPLDSTGRAYYGANLEGNVSASDFGVYTADGAVKDTLDMPLAKHLRHLNKIRRAVPALQKGQYSKNGISGTGMAFKRRYTKDGEDSMVLVCISGNATFTGLPSGRWVDAITGDVQNGTTVTTSGCSSTANMRVYVLDGSGIISGDSPYLN